MRRVAKPLAIVLVVPIVVTVLGLLGRSNWEARIDPLLARMMAAQQALPGGSSQARPSLALVCADSRLGPQFPPCRTFDLFSVVIRISAVVGGAGLVWLAALFGAGQWLGGDRRRMARLFQPALAAATLGTAALGLCQGLLAVLAVEVGAGALWLEPVERVPGSLLLVAIAAGAGWALAMGSVAFSLIKRPPLTVVGLALDLAGQRAFTGMLESVALAVGAERPDNVVVCLVPWLFVTEMRVTCLERRVSGRTLCLSLPLARLLSVDELRAQLAHELAHYSPGQVAFTSRVAAPLAGVRRAMMALEGRSHGIRGVVTTPPLALLSVFMDSIGDGGAFDAERERAADQAAAAVAGREALASGLVKLAAFAPAWQAVFAMMQNAAYSETQYVNASTVFQEIAASNAGRERLVGVERMAQGHPIDWHAPLAERLDSLGVDLQDVSAAALVVAPQSPAAGLIEGCDAIEQELSKAEHQMIVEMGGRTSAG
jgi:Zn-dependent protease with chaperone function